MKTKSMFKFENRKRALVLFWVSVAMCLICAASIAVAEIFMPENYHGQKGVLTFYRVFGVWFFIHGIVATVTYYQMKQISARNNL